MSGGHFDYKQHACEDIARDIDNLVKEGAYPPDIIEKFRKAAHAIRRAGDMVQRVDYLVCGDDGEDSFRERWEKEVRPSWSATKKKKKRA